MPSARHGCRMRIGDGARSERASNRTTTGPSMWATRISGSAKCPATLLRPGQSLAPCADTTTRAATSSPCRRASSSEPTQVRARVRAAADSRKIAGSIAGRSLWFRICAISAHVRDSLWFFSALVVLAHAVLALVLIGLSDSVPDRLLEDYPRLLGADADSSRILLSTIAGSIVTVAGVTFSITVLVMAQAAYQYTPRILRNFLRDRQSQIVLGVLIGVFVYCLVVMHAIRTEPDLVPSLAVLAGVVLALFAVGALV